MAKRIMTLQEIFDRCATKMLEQNARAYTTSPLTKRAVVSNRDEEGNLSPIGILTENSGYYFTEFDRMKSNDIRIRKILHLSRAIYATDIEAKGSGSPNLQLVAVLTQTYNEIGPDGWVESLRSVARMFSLDPEVVESVVRIRAFPGILERMYWQIRRECVPKVEGIEKFTGKDPVTVILGKQYREGMQDLEMYSDTVIEALRVAGILFFDHMTKPYKEDFRALCETDKASLAFLDKAELTHHTYRGDEWLDALKSLGRAWRIDVDGIERRVR